MRAHFFTRRSPSEPWTPEWRGSRYLPAQSCAPIAQERAALLRPGSLLPRGPVAIIRSVPASPPDAARDRPVALLVLLRVEGSHDPPILMVASRAAPGGPPKGPCVHFGVDPSGSPPGRGCLPPGAEGNDDEDLTGPDPSPPTEGRGRPSNEFPTSASRGTSS